MKQYWAGYFDTVAARLAPGGQALIQSITIDDAQFEHYRRGTDFIQQFIFPRWHVAVATRFRSEADKAGLGTLESFAFGKDYAETLRRWRDAFEQQLGGVRALGFDEAFIRIWRCIWPTARPASIAAHRRDGFHLRKAADHEPAICGGTPPPTPVAGAVQTAQSTRWPWWRSPPQTRADWRGQRVWLIGASSGIGCPRRRAAGARRISGPVRA